MSPVLAVQSCPSPVAPSICVLVAQYTMRVVCAVVGISGSVETQGMDRPDAQLPIIAMTANLFDEDVAACLAAGMDAHIPKPLEAGQMIRTIAEWLERKKQ